MVTPRAGHDGSRGPGSLSSPWSRRASERKPHHSLPENRFEGLRVDGLALPDHGRSPSEVSELFDHPLVSRNIRPEFLIPEFDIRLGSGRLPATFVSVPEASVNEQCKRSARKNDVGFAGQRVPAETESQTKAVGDFANLQFRGGISSANAGHQPRATLGTKAIGHKSLRSCADLILAFHFLN